MARRPGVPRRSLRTATGSLASAWTTSTPWATRCLRWRPAPGARIFARCAVGTAIAVGTALESAGDGLLRAATTGVIVAEAWEAELAVG